MASIWQTIKSWFTGERYDPIENHPLPNDTYRTSTPPTTTETIPPRTHKRFEINESPNHTPERMDDRSRRTNKKFEIKSERQINISRPGSGRGFANASVSRPRQCPLCRSQNTIIKASDGNAWECSKNRNGCGYTWS